MLPLFCAFSSKYPQIITIELSVKTLFSELHAQTSRRQIHSILILCAKAKYPFELSKTLDFKLFIFVKVLNFFAFSPENKRREFTTLPQGLYIRTYTLPSVSHFVKCTPSLPAPVQQQYPLFTKMRIAVSSLTRNTAHLPPHRVGKLL